MLRKRLTILLDPVVWRSTPAHDPDCIARMNQALFFEDDGTNRVQRIVNDLVLQVKDDIHNGDVKGSSPRQNLHGLVNVAFNSVVEILAHDVGFSCSLSNPKDVALSLQRPRWLYMVAPSDRKMKEAEDALDEPGEAEVEIVALREEMAAMKISFAQQMKAMHSAIVDEIRNPGAAEDAH